MARAVKTTAAPAKPTPPARKVAPRPVPPTKRAAVAPIETPVIETPRGAAKPSRSAPARTTTTAPAPTVAPKLSKDELRAQVAKLEGSNATLRAKSRDMNRAIKAANSRIAELEAEIAELREQVAATEAVNETTEAPKASRRARTTRKAPIDPGDAVPPGVAVAEPQPLDEEAQAARDALEEKLSGG